jgi:DNA-binding LacI/PurR family transcriptional regulator
MDMPSPWRKRSSRCDFSIHTAADLIQELLSRKRLKVEGIVTSNNLTSIGLMAVLDREKTKIGQDLGVVGIDKVRSFSELGLPFSHIERDTRLVGRRAVEKLIERIENPGKKTENVIIPAHLVLEGTE